MPVRKVLNRGSNIIGQFPSLKMKRMIAFESLIERDYLYLLDFEPDVERFEEQPLTIEYRHAGKVLHYTPDFQVVRAGRNVLVECKPEDFVDTDENRPKFTAAHHWCEECGWEFHVVTDKQIRAGCRLRNIKTLTRYARHTVAPATKGSLYATLEAAHHSITIGDLASVIAPDHRPAAIASILHMAFHHEVAIPVDDEPISEDTPVSRRVSETTKG